MLKTISFAKSSFFVGCIGVALIAFAMWGSALVPDNTKFILGYFPVTSMIFAGIALLSAAYSILRRHRDRQFAFVGLSLAITTLALNFILFAIVLLVIVTIVFFFLYS